MGACGRLLALVGLAFASACNDGAVTQVVVYLSAEPALLGRARGLTVQVENDEGVRVLDHDKTLDGKASRLARIPIVPKNGDPTRRFRVFARLLDASSKELASLNAEAGFHKDELRELNLVFQDACAGHAACGEGRTCDRGHCAGSCFEPKPAGHADPDHPVCGECARCTGSCEAADESACGCPGETCKNGGCVPSVRVLFADAGERHSCAVLEDGSVHCWGSTTFEDGSAGLLGTGARGVDSATPVEVPMATCRRGLTLAGGHVCCSDDDGRVCWGENDVGQLGGDLGNVVREPHAFHDGLMLESMASGFRHTCGLSGDGRLYCWGYNERGNLGLGTTTRAELMPQQVGTGYAQVAAGGDHTCAVSSDGELQCFGFNDSNELGTPGADVIATPVRPGCERASSGQACFHDWIGVGAGAFHSCGIRASGKMYCWGGNQNGQLGIGPPTSSFQESEPHLVVGNEHWADVDGGRSYTCALTQQGALYCWGLNEDRQLGMASADFVSAPTKVDVDAPGGWRYLGLGSYHACAVRADRTLYCWGRNRDGQIGTGVASEEPVATPTRVCF